MTPPSPHGPSSPLLDRIRSPGRRSRPAVSGADGAWTYEDLCAAAESAAERFGEAAGGLASERVAYLFPPGRAHVAALLAAWNAGATAVPLALSHPLPEQEHVLDDAAPRLVVADPALPQARAVARAAEDRGATALLLSRDVLATAASARPPHSSPDAANAAGPRPPHSSLDAANAGRPPPADLPPREEPPPGGGRPAPPSQADDALIVYTSGTTGRPKGVVVDHERLAAQIRALVRAWEWSAHDRILHVLPLHHVHGLAVALCCALWSGAACEFARPRPEGIWERWTSGGVSLFMAVPTVYARLARAWEEAPEAIRRRWSRGAAGLRLMVSGSAALPVSLFERWRVATGHELLERYGMTETGMTLSNPLAGQRRPGHVGHPLPGVEVRLVAPGGAVVAEGEAGEIEVRGAQVFAEYWRRPGATAAAFRDGWFRTGDLARVEGGSHRILGRQGTDILKTGGYRVSALEVEETYRTHPDVRDIAVAGVPDPEWGHRLCAAYVPAEGLPPAAPDDLRAWGKARLAPYKVPRAFAAVDRLPRNAMGKTLRRDVALLFEGGTGGTGRDASPRTGPDPAPGPAAAKAGAS